MDSIIEQWILGLVKQLITKEVVQKFEVQLVTYLKGLAADTSNKIDDAMVQAIADALGVVVP